MISIHQQEAPEAVPTQTVPITQHQNAWWETVSIPIKTTRVKLSRAVSQCDVISATKLRFKVASNSVSTEEFKQAVADNYLEIKLNLTSVWKMHMSTMIELSEKISVSGGNIVEVQIPMPFQFYFNAFQATKTDLNIYYNSLVPIPAFFRKFLRGKLRPVHIR